MKEKSFILSCIVLALLTSGCTAEQVGQAIYESVKSDECMKTQGKALCDLNEE